MSWGAFDSRMSNLCPTRPEYIRNLVGSVPAELVQLEDKPLLTSLPSPQYKPLLHENLELPLGKNLKAVIGVVIF